jgi:hypothetical protein
LEFSLIVVLLQICLLCSEDRLPLKFSGALHHRPLVRYIGLISDEEEHRLGDAVDHELDGEKASGNRRLRLVTIMSFNRGYLISVLSLIKGCSDEIQRGKVMIGVMIKS